VERLVQDSRTYKFWARFQADAPDGWLPGADGWLRFHRVERKADGMTVSCLDRVLINGKAGWWYLVQLAGRLRRSASPSTKPKWRWEAWIIPETRLLQDGVPRTAAERHSMSPPTAEEPDPCITESVSLSRVSLQKGPDGKYLSPVQGDPHSEEAGWLFERHLQWDDLQTERSGVAAGALELLQLGSLRASPGKENTDESEQVDDEDDDGYDSSPESARSPRVLRSTKKARGVKRRRVSVSGRAASPAPRRRAKPKRQSSRKRKSRPAPAAPPSEPPSRAPLRPLRLGQLKPAPKSEQELAPMDIECVLL
jgi:hypothetical protein